MFLQRIAKATDGKELVHMFADDLTVLNQHGMAANDWEVAVDVKKSEIDNGFRTISFSCGIHELKAYLDIRNERGGAYQFTYESRYLLDIHERNRYAD